MKHTDIIQFFKNRISAFKTQENIFKSQDKKLAIWRVLFFVILLIGIVWMANFRNFYGLIAILGLGFFIFGFVIKYHNKIKFKHRHFHLLRKINQMEINRLEGNFSHFQNQGSQFINPKHPYSSDLDIFGKNSLFQWICRAETVSGQTKLAEFLQAPASKNGILERQKAVQELAQNTDFRHRFEAYGKHFQDIKKVQKFQNPIESEELIFADKKWLLLGIGMPLLFVASSVGVFFGLPYWIPFLMLVLNGMVLKQNFEKVSETIENTGKILSEIQAFAKLAELIETGSFESPLLSRLQNTLKNENTPSSLIIKKLHQSIENLEFRQNAFFYGFVNVPFLWEIHQMRRFETLKKAHQNQWTNWFEAVAEFEALNSFGGLAFACQDFNFPEISDKPYHFEAQNLGHPLIFPTEKRVCNDFSMQGKSVCNLITGSNMSGKSTFLRTMGLNIILGSAGAPICANQSQLTPVQVFTSMRTEDSLSESISSFYAELKRIRQLLDRVENGENVLYFLDEILKGTNSDDRHRGAKAIIKQLQNQEVAGFISTHDLDLGKQSEILPKTVRNFSFNSQIIDQELVFEYRISDGICRSFNASILMQKIGIQIDM